MSTGEGVGVCGCCGPSVPQHVKVQALYASYTDSSEWGPEITLTTDPSGPGPYYSTIGPFAPRDPSDAIAVLTALSNTYWGSTNPDPIDDTSTFQVNDVGLGNQGVVSGSYGCLPASGGLAGSFGDPIWGPIMTTLNQGNFTPGTQLCATLYADTSFGTDPQPFAIYDDDADYWVNMTIACKYRIAFDAAVTYFVGEIGFSLTQWNQETVESSPGVFQSAFVGAGSYVLDSTATLIASGTLPGHTWLTLDAAAPVIPGSPTAVGDVIPWAKLRFVVYNTPISTWTARTGIPIS